MNKKNFFLYFWTTIITIAFFAENALLFLVTREAIYFLFLLLSSMIGIITLWAYSSCGRM